MADLRSGSLLPKHALRDCSPASAGSAPAGGTSSEPSAAAKPAPSPFAGSPPPSVSKEQGEQEPRAENHEEDPHQHQKDEKTDYLAPCQVRFLSLALIAGWRGGGRLGQAIQRDMTSLCDHRRDLPHDLRGSMVVIALSQKRDHIAAKAAHFAVGKNRLESVPNLRPIFVIVDREQHHHASVRALVAHSPLLEKVVREVLYVIALQGLDCGKGDLGLGFLVNFPAQSCQFFYGRRVEHTGKIVDISMRIKFLPLLRMGGHDGYEGE